ncbi:MAG: RnfABCDGE type electron transport complex subunit B [Clostridia bacterium]|nr:RnfABCDGE type electron transport complex subunit B [Clostridia bacterium]
MNIIIITTAVIAAIGLVVGAGLVYTGRKFQVEVDETEVAVRECLPGNNCGACGYAGCDAMAAAIAAGEAPVNGCPVGGTPAAQKIAAIMGGEAEPVVRRTAFVRCKGSCDVTRYQGNYVGVRDCRTAVLSGLNVTDCNFGCLGFGSCQTVCPQHAIRVVNGVAVVNRDLCVACGLCVKACPRGLIELVPETRDVVVQCSNRDKGPAVKKVCSAGCIGCGLCVRQCEHDAIHVDGNLAHVDYDACVQCGKCVEKCPVKVITAPKAPAQEQSA